MLEALTTEQKPKRFSFCRVVRYLLFGVACFEMA